MATIKQLAEKETLFSSGHRACAGCTAPLIARQMLMASDVPVVVGSATGCLEVVSTIFPFTAWKCSFVHSAFENSAATVSGIEAAYRSLKRRGRMESEFRFIAMGGDGGTYDIGFQSLSGAMERGHRMLYICYDNQGYMNTGFQRSSATPTGAHTTTAPAGKVVGGKQQRRKDLTQVMVAHDIPFAAQSTPTIWNDFVGKVEKALAIDGPTFINTLCPCPTGWGFDPKDSIELGELAVETCFWPCYEVENGQYRLTRRPRKKVPVAEWMKRQVRFRHLFAPGQEARLEAIQAEVDRKWNQLLVLCGEPPAEA
jgi:pyruvate ferredoxin oxidoreductase beta subunit